MFSLKKVAIIYKYLYIINNKLYNKLSGGHLCQIQLFYLKKEKKSLHSY